MQEDFLHFLWRYQKFDWTQLRTTKGESLSLIHPGEPNNHGGPDFLNARLWVGDTLWAGNVEIHTRASEWYAHQHDTDPAYDNVILHVVLEEDKPIFRKNGERLPCLELQRRIFPGMRAMYHQLLHDQTHWIPCQPQISQCESHITTLWLDRLSVERLEQRVEKLQTLLNHNTQDWEETFYQVLARNLGQPANADPFEALARITPLALLRKKRHDLFQLEALLFGQAGFLDAPFQDEYPKSLQKEYTFLKREFNLTPMSGSPWKFLRMRPANFPTLRIAQIARLIHQSDRLFEKAMSAANPQEIQQLFELKVSQYWRTHYRFDHSSAPKHKSLGKSTIYNILINTVAPFLFLYGLNRQNNRYCDRAMEVLAQTPAEDNQTIRAWKNIGIQPANALQSQALLHLKKHYCEAAQCLHCAIGMSILKHTEP